MLDWVRDHQVLVFWVTGVSVALFVATLVLVPAIIVRIPADYFTHEERPPSRWANRHRLLRAALFVGKNLVGYICLLAGVAMLILPGQGLLTLFIGFLLVDFPGKYRAERWVISRRRVLKAINWFRQKRGREPLRAAAGAAGAATSTSDARGEA